MVKSALHVAGQLADGYRRVWHSATQRVMSVTAIGMLLALLADILVAARLGTSTNADILIIAVGLVRLIEIVAREGTKFSLVALFTERSATLSTADYAKFVSGLLNLFLLIGLGLTLLGWPAAPQIINLFGPGLSEQARQEAVPLFRLSMPMALFAIGSTVLSAHLNSRHHFVVVSLRNAAVPLAVITVMILAWRSLQIDMWIAAAHSVGYALYFVLLLGYSIKRAKFLLGIRNWPQRHTLSGLLSAVSYPIMGFGANQGTRAAERALASLVAPGGVTAYYFAFRLITSLQAIIGISAATTGLPQATRHALRSEKDKLTRMLSQRARYVVAISLPITVVVVLFHEQIIETLYERGAFDASSVAQTSQVLLFLGFGLVFMSLGPVQTSGLFALRKYSWVLFLMILGAAFNLLLAWRLSSTWGLAGLALAVTLTAILAAVIRPVLVRIGIRRA